MVQVNTLLIVYLTVFIICSGSKWVLDSLNIRQLKACGAKVPEVFAGQIDQETLSRMRDYTVVNSRFGKVARICNDVLVLVILLSGVLPWFSGWVGGLGHGFILSGLIFFFGFATLTGLLEIPFELYSTFVIEKRFNFNTMTLRLWLVDLVKSVLISGVVMAIFLSVFLALIAAAPDSWWLWVWLFYVGFQLLMVWLYPVLIAPLFNKFEPIGDEALRTAIMDLARRAGMNVSGIFRMDAGKRSRHSNAYFTGIGRTKRIVLYDTLLDEHAPAEIIAVLAHELGHFKMGHIRKQLALGMVLSLGGLYLAYYFLSGPLLYATFGIEDAAVYAGLLILGLVAKPFAFFISPLVAMLSRRFERQADRFAFDLTGSSQPLVAGLKRLAKDNLANLHPHPAYAWFYYSHPPIVERVEYLQSMR